MKTGSSFFGILLVVSLTACGLFPKPELSVTPTSLQMNSTTSTATLSLQNVGDKGLAWTVTTSSTRLTVSPTSGSLSQGSSSTMQVDYYQGGLTVGDTVTAYININSNGGNRRVTVEFAVTQSTAFECYPTSTLSTSGGSATLRTTSSDLSGPTSFVPGQLLVKYADEVTPGLQPPALNQLQADYQVEMLARGGAGMPDLLRVAQGTNPELMAARLRADPRVEYAEPNYYLYPLLTPNDAFWTDQWNMSDFGLPQAWDIERGSADVTVAIIDTGIDTDHEDLVDKMLPGCDLYDDDSDPNPDPLSSSAEHGSHVAGIALATGNNLSGVAGVAFEGTKLLPVKVFDDAGITTDIFTVARAIRWAAGLDIVGPITNPKPADILNLSLGGPGTSSTLNDAVRDARAAGALVFAASGNDELGADGSEIFTPANAPDALAVGSIDQDKLRSDFSMYGVSGPTVQFMAPGGFGSNSCGVVRSSTTNDTYNCMAGTSMATPFVSGVAALVWSQNPTWTADQVQSKLTQTTLFDSSFMNSAEYGAGIVCADKALGAQTLCGF